MKFFSDFFRAIGNCFKAFPVLFEKGLWPYMFYALIIWLGVWAATLFGLMSLASYVSDGLKDYINAESIPEKGHWLSFARPVLVGNLGLIIKLVLKIIFWFISSTFVKYLWLMALSPLFATLAEKTDEKLTGNNFPFNFKQMLNDIFRGVVINLRNMLLEYFFIFACFLFNILFAPSVFITTPFLFFLGWYFVGFSLLDYNSERHKYGVKKSIDFIKQNRGYACGIGFVYSVFMNLPFLAGSVIGIMFGPAVAVVGATLSFLAIKENRG